MFGSTASKALIVSWRALFSASADCQPESLAVPETDRSRLAPADPPAALLAPVLAPLLSPELLVGAADAPPPPVEGAGVAPPLVHAPAIITIEAPRANTDRRIGVLLRGPSAARTGGRTRRDFPASVPTVRSVPLAPRGATRRRGLSSVAEGPPDVAAT